MSEACSMYGEVRVHTVLFEKLQRKILLAGLRRTLVDSIKMDFRETGCENVDGIHLA